MKLQMDMHEATGQGFDTVADFAIEMNPKAFQVLSDTIYKDKIGSIVRELGCNAFDAHVDSGNGDKPFEIHLPDAFEPFFSIRDFGFGISPEDIKAVYTRYFASTKEQSNDVVGAFGLGSKTPFAYTDAFTVISIHKGVKYMYNAHKSGGLPSIVAFGEPEVTDEPEGLEVRVSVEAMDYGSFASAVKRQLKFFPVKPNIVNGEVAWQSYNPILETDGFAYYSVDNFRRPMYGHSNDNVLSGLFIKQGPVGYPVDFDALNQVLDSKGIKRTSFYDYLQRSVDLYSGKGIIIDMPIGTVEVTASREGISYKDVTVTNIMQRLDQISRSISREVLVKLDESYNTGVLAFAQMINSLDGYFKHSLKAEDMEKRYPKFAFSDNISGVTTTLKIPTSVFDGVEIRKYDLVSYQQARATNAFTLRAKNVNPSDKGSALKKFINIDLCSIAGGIDNDGNHNVIYVKDIGTGFVARLKEHNSGNHAFLVDDSVTKAELESALGDEFTIRNVSELPKVVSARGGSGTRTGHSITGGRQRLWFKIVPDSIASLLNQDTTCYAANLKQVFGDSFKDQDEGDKFAFFTTFNNKIKTPSIDADVNMIQLFATWLQREGYELVAIAGGMTKKAEKSGNFQCVDKLWNKYQNDFKSQTWDMFLDTMLNNYYHRLWSAYIYEGWTQPYALKTYGNLLNRLGVTEVKPLRDQIALLSRLVDNTDQRMVSSAMRGIIEQDKNHAADLNTLCGALTPYGDSESTMKEIEDILEKHGKTLEVSGQKLVTGFIKLIEENIVNLITLSAVDNCSFDLRRVKLVDPVNNEVVMMDSDQWRTKILKKLGVGG